MKKRILALFLCVIMVLALVACGEAPVNPDSGTGSNPPISSGNSDEVSSSDTDATDKESGSAANGYDATLEHKVIISDRAASKILVLDLNVCGTDFQKLPETSSAIVWEWDATTDPNLKSKNPGRGLDSAKYRYSEYYKKDVIIACSSDGWAGVIDYEDRTLLWESDDRILHNAHSIEMLPNGDVVVSVSKEKSHSGLVYFPLSAGVTDYSSAIPSEYSHGVSWDPENNWLWVLEQNEIVAVKVSGMGTENAKLLRLTGSGAAPGHSGGHAFAPVGGQPGSYWASFGLLLYQYDSEDKSLTKVTHLSDRDTKGICSFADGTVVQVVADPGTVKSSDLHIIIRQPSEGKFQQLRNIETVVTFSGSEFYKVQVFTKDYQ